VVCSINGVELPVEYAGRQGTQGLEQINIRLLPELKGHRMPIGFMVLTINGVVANGVWLFFR